MSRVPPSPLSAAAARSLATPLSSPPPRKDVAGGRSASKPATPATYSKFPVGADGLLSGHRPLSSTGKSVASRAGQSTDITRASTPHTVRTHASGVMGAEAAAAALYAAKMEVKMARMAELEAAKQRYTKRFIVLADFHKQVLSKITWKKSFRGAIEVASSYSNVSTNLDAKSACKINCGALNTAFWNAACVPEHLHMPVAMVDEHIKTLFRYFDHECSGTIDFRNLLAALSFFGVGMLEPTNRLLRAWYRAYDSEASGGITPLLFMKMMQTIAATEEEVWAIERIVGNDIRSLLALSTEHRKGTRTLADKMTAWANASRLAKRFGPAYLKASVAAGDTLPSFVEAVWSPYDVSIQQQEYDTDLLHIEVITEWLAVCPEIQDELLRQRIANTTPENREIYYENERRKKAIEDMAAREVIGGQRADRHHRVVLLMKMFTAWTSTWSRNQIIKRHVEEFQRQRSVRNWNKFTKQTAIERNNEAKAFAFSAQRLIDRMYGYWVSYVQIETDKHKVGLRRAMRFHYTTLTSGPFDAWREAVHWRKAVQMHTRVMLLRYFIGWAGISTGAVLVNLSTQKDVIHVEKSGVQANVLDMDRRLREAQLAAEHAAALQQHKAEVEAYQKQAAADHERQIWTQAKLAAEAALRDKNKVKQQVIARRTTHAIRKVKMEQDFQADWKEKIIKAMDDVKNKTKLWLKFNKNGRREHEAAAHLVMFSKSVQDASQEASEFVASLSLEDGCIHFTREEDKIRGYTALDYNIDAMTMKEGLEVGMAHYAAKKAVERKEEMLEDQARAWIQLGRDTAATCIQRNYRASRIRIATLTSLRGRLELLCDPYTTELYYWDTEQGSSVNFPLRVCGTIFLLHPLPEWALKISYAEDGTARQTFVRVPVPKEHYLAVIEDRKRKKSQLRAHRIREYEATTGLSAAHTHTTEIKWAKRNTDIPDTITELAMPPRNFIMCQACGSDFARRQCDGSGCNGYKYCWTCFMAYHPQADPEWAPHWDVAVSKQLYAKAGGEATPEEKWLMIGKKPRQEGALTGRKLTRIHDDESSISGGSDDDIRRNRRFSQLSDARSVEEEGTSDESDNTPKKRRGKGSKGSIATKGSKTSLASKSSMVSKGSVANMIQKGSSFISSAMSFAMLGGSGAPKHSPASSRTVSRVNSKAAMSRRTSRVNSRVDNTLSDDDVVSP